MFVARVRAWQADGASDAAVADAMGQLPSPHGGTNLERLGPERMADRARALLAFDPATMDAAIDGTFWIGYDPDASVSCPVTVLRATPAMGAVFRPEHEARFRAAVPQARVAIVAGQGHEIHNDPEGRAPFLAALDRFLAALD